MHHDPNPPRVHNPARTAVTGGVGLLIGVILCLTPLVMGNWRFNKYPVFLGFVMLLFGVSLLLNATIDWLRGKR